ncbi:hypothetical protein ACFX1W_037986 [Malus domestica]
MNPLKCAFGVTSRKFLGFILKHRGIEVDQSKIKAIQSMPEPRNLHELKSLQGRLAFIRRFISNLAGRCQPFNRLMKKDVPFVWDEACHNAFESIKKYLSSPPVLGAPVPGKPFILYIAAQESSKLRHYMHAYTIHLVAKVDPIIYVPAKAIKGQALADFLADHPIPADWKISDDLPDEEVFHIDIFLTWTIELCSNNVAEYQALIIGLQIAINMEITTLEVYGDSKLIINQLLTEYEVRKDDLVPYFRLATQLLQKFEAVTLEHVLRKENQMADALANLASSMTLGEDEAADVLVCQRWSMENFQMIFDTALKYVDEHLASSTTKKHSTGALSKEYF